MKAKTLVMFCYRKSPLVSEAIILRILWEIVVGRGRGVTVNKFFMYQGFLVCGGGVD